MHRRRLGDAEVGAIGLGAMPLSVAGRPPEERAVATIHAALDAGVTLIDTADAYAVGPGDFGCGEELIARALRSYGGDTSDVVVATKGGHTRPSDDEWALDGSRDHLVRAAEASARRLGVEAVGLSSTTVPTRPCRTRRRSARCASCSTRGRSGWPASRTPTPPGSAWRGTSSARAW